MLVSIRRVLWLVLVAAVGGAAFSWFRNRNPSEPSGPAEWPPLPKHDPTPPATVSNSPVSTATSPAAPPVDSPSLDPSPANPGGTRSSDTTANWSQPDETGSCPVSHPIKAKANSGIFHVPGGRFYDRTNADRCYQSADDAAADGYRQAKN